MTIDRKELEELFNTAESDRVERKESYSDPERIRQIICAAANDLPNYKKPGVILIGQKDDLSPGNLKVDDDLLLRLGGLRSDGRIHPFPTMYVSKEVINGCELAVVIIEPSDNPPVKLEGRTWIRTGPRRAIATVEEERRLVEKRRWGNLPYDAHGVPGTTLDDLNLRVFQEEYLPSAIPQEVLKDDKRSPQEQMRALRMLDQDGIPTVTAMLTLGKDPRAVISGAYVQFLRVDGSQLTDPIKNERVLGGTIGEQIRQLDDLLKANIQQAANVGGIVRMANWDYPETALRQLLRNAILHRAYEGTNAPVRVTWYNDRVEIQSPGGPFGQVTKENFGRPGIADYRNPTLAEALKNMAYVERFGIGIAIARSDLVKNGNPEPIFTVEDQHVHVSIGSAK